MTHKLQHNRLLAILMAICLLICAAPVPAHATEEASAPEYTIPEDAILISSATDLVALAENCISDSWSREKTVVLQNDISLSGVNFEGIPTFGGTFLGQGYTISGLKLTRQQSAQGFFRYLQKTALVQDLNLKGSVKPSKTGNTDIGGFVGINSGTVRGCSFNGTVTGSERIGGIAGKNKVSGIIENCTVAGTVYGDHYIGGITGENLGVVRDCVNTAPINSRVDQNSVSVAISSGFSLESFYGKESISDATNLGGIAGTSSGVIRSCRNLADVGYEKMGYNVGGIAGSQIGYIADCENYGTINGSNGVGGIVGQFKPNVVLDFGENLMSKLMDQMTSMMGSMTGLMGSMDGMMDGMSFEMDNMEDSMDILGSLESFDPETWDPEELDPDSINAALNEFSNSFNDMYTDMTAMGSDMTSQMNSMMVSMNDMVDTMERLNQGMNIRILDLSKEDTPEDQLSKISSSANYGPVYGETYVGGIAGLADVEDTTVQEDLTGQLSFATEGQITMRLVIRDCRNLAAVSASKEFAGGIVGKMSVGAVFHGMNIGPVDALNADYVGGIAGSSETYIADSFNRCILSGHQYVGGIAGLGTEVDGCYAITEIAAATQFAGGILGLTDPLPEEGADAVRNNHYVIVGKDYGGIDGIRYEAATNLITLEDYLALETLDDLFRTVTVTFRAEGVEDTVLTAELGKSVPYVKVPQLKVEEHELYQWVLQEPVATSASGMGAADSVTYLSKDRLSGLLFQQTYQAEFDGKNQAIATAKKAANGRSLALAVGAFDHGTTLTLTQLTDSDIPVLEQNVLEAWQVELSDVGVEKLHFAIPGDLTTENIGLYVQDISGNWVRRDFTVEGSYLILPFAHGEAAFALVELSSGETPIFFAAAAAGIAVAVLILGFRAKKKKSKKENPSVEA